MNHKTTLLVSIVALSLLALTGCGNHVKIDHTNAARAKMASKANKETPAQASSRKASESRAMSKHHQEFLGKVIRFGLPEGNSDFYLLAQDPAKKVHLSMTKHVVTKLHENNSVSFGADLPLIGTVTSRTVSLGEGPNVRGATMDEADDFDKMITFAGSGALDMSFNSFPHANVKALTQQIFSDTIKYYAAMSTADASKLPNQSEELKGALPNTDMPGGGVETTYHVLKQFFDKGSLNPDPGKSNSNFSTVLHHSYNGNTDTVAVTLDVQSCVKLKSTDVRKQINGVLDNDNYGKTTTSIVANTLTYQLVDGSWQLREVSNEDSSPYDQDTSGANWVTETY